MGFVGDRPTPAMTVAPRACRDDMTKSDLFKRVAEVNNLSKARAETVVSQVFACIEESLQRGERVEIRALGSFEIRRYGSYTGRNPRTGVAVSVNPKRLPFFRASQKLKEMLNPSVIRTQDLPAVREDRRQWQTQNILRTAQPAQLPATRQS